MTRRVYEAAQPLRSIAGAAVLVTGAASGMGAATARLFAAEGAWVAVTDRHESAAAGVAADIVAQGGHAQAWQLDVGRREEIERVVGEVAAQFQGLDCVINNAGFSPRTAIDGDDFEQIWDSGIAVMLSAIPYAVRAALPWLRASPFPRIVNIASTEAVASTGQLTPYSAAKAGVTGVTRGLAVELGAEGITCNCILPGPIETGLTVYLDEEKRNRFARRRTALRRYGKPEEVAQIILSLCLPGASYITGATIPVDGGLLIRNG